MTRFQVEHIEQFPLHLRAVYFVFVGLVVRCPLALDRLFSLPPVIPLPLGLFLMNRTGMALTLYRYD